MNLMTILAMLAVSISVNAAKNTRTLASFETADDLKALRTHETAIQPTTRYATDGPTALETTFKPAEWPNVSMISPTPWDWSGFDGLALEITNPGRVPIDFGVRVDDDPTGGPQHWRQGSGNIKPGESATFVLPLGPDPMSYGMRGLPTPSGMRGLRGDQSRPINLSHGVAVQGVRHKPAAPM
ncbi:MAG: hypothetical protein ACUVXJ_07925, partial [Phycisphaerae bacterium]